MLIIFEWASKALIQANPSGLRRRKWGSNSLTYLLISKGFWRPKASQWGRMIQEDPRRQNFWSPPISAKPTPYRRARRYESNDVGFTSNGLRMRKLSRSVLWGQQAKLAKRGAMWHHWHSDTWHPYCMDMMTWHVYEPMRGRHVACTDGWRVNPLNGMVQSRGNTCLYGRCVGPVIFCHMALDDWLKV